jgi:hypothetical protein
VVSRTDRKLSPKDAAARLEEALPALRTRAGTSSAAHGTEHYLFEKLVSGLTDAIRLAGSTRITLTYAEWALVANARKTGKRTSSKNVERIFSKWADAFDGFSSAEGVLFAIQRPGKRGPKLDPGRAGAEVIFWTEDDRQQSVRAPQRPTEIPLLTEVHELVEAARLRELLAPSRLEYLNEVRQRIGVKASKLLGEVIERVERRLATEHSRRVAAYFVTAFLTVCLIGGGVAVAAHRAARERLLHTLNKYTIAAAAVCDGDIPTVVISFAAPSLPPPFLVIRNDEIVGKITASVANGSYRYVDRTVSMQRSYAYRVGKKVWDLGAPAVTPPVSAQTPNCRPSDNQPPEVSEIAVSMNPAVIGRPVMLSVSAHDYDNESLRYYWSIPSVGVARYGNNAEEFTFTHAGYQTAIVTVSDGFAPGVSRSINLGVAAPGNSNRLPVIRKLFVGPRIVHPNEQVRAAVAAHDPDGGSLQYAWDYEDGSGRGLDDIFGTTSYPTPGTYRIGVRAIDEALAESQEEREVRVAASVPAGPRCKWITAAPSLWPPISMPVSLRVLLEDGSPRPTHVTWDFGDGSPPVSGGLSALRTYRRAGVYQVIAEIDNAQNSDVCYVELNVGTGMPPNQPIRNSGITEPASGSPDTTFVITAQPPVEAHLTGEIKGYRFTFDDSVHGIQLQTRWQATPIYRIQLRPGSWSVTYEVRYAGDRGTAVYSVGDIPVSERP